MMKNTFYHPSLPSEFSSIENSEFRMANLEAPSLIDTKMSMYNNGYCFHPPRSFPADNNWLRGGGGGDHLDLPDHHILELQPGHEYMTYGPNIPHLSITKLLILPPPADGLSKTMKRPLEAEYGRIAGEDFGESSVSCDWKKSKRQRAVPPCSSSQCHHHHLLKEYSAGIPRGRLPGSRSQKIGDKITTLQKLVSPYGKTDTASVLQEASLYIKLLQDQIQNLFQMLTNSYSSTRGIQPQLGSVHACGETSVNGECPDLRSWGLCLLPISSVCGDTAIYQPGVRLRSNGDYSALMNMILTDIRKA